MIVSIKYDPENPEDEKTINRILKSRRMARVLFEITHNLRGRMENTAIMGKDAYDVIEFTMEVISDTLITYGLTIDDFT